MPFDRSQAIRLIWARTPEGSRATVNNLAAAVAISRTCDLGHRIIDVHHPRLGRGILCLDCTDDGTLRELKEGKR